jgi:hypothetical protein
MIFYYSASKKVFYDRISALKDGEPYFLYYYDKEYLQFDWTVEPSEPLKELYKQRAQQIRDKYDYIILAYSGGIDSTNMLESFYYNNIHIDEILTVGALSQDSVEGSDENHNGDLYHNVFPTLRKMSLPKTKVTVKDYSLLFGDYKNLMPMRKYGNEWIKGMGGSYLSPHQMFWRSINEYLKYPDKKIALIYAVDKPVLFHDGKGLYFEFSDGNLQGYNNTIENFERVNFYWEPTAAKMLIKQLHMIKRFFLEEVAPAPGNKYLYNRYSTRIIEKIIYDVKNPLVHQSKKSRSKILSLRDNFILNNKDSDVFKLYKEGIVRLQKELTASPIACGTMSLFLSRRYYV